MTSQLCVIDGQTVTHSGLQMQRRYLWETGE